MTVMWSAASFGSYMMINLNKYLEGSIYLNYYLEGLAGLLSAFITNLIY